MVKSRGAAAARRTARSRALGRGSVARSSSRGAAVFGANLRGLRESSGMTLDQLGDLTGYTRSMLSQIELGQTVPDARRIPAIARAFGVSVERLFEGMP